jgi:hypothetical protein
MVTDYKALNKRIVQEVHGVPNYWDIYDALAESKANIFSVIDLKGSFHALPVEKNSQQYTAFTTGYGEKFNYLRAPYGISSIPSHLCRLMCYVLSVDDGPLYRFALSYLDDILLFSRLDLHEKHLQEVFDRLRKYQIKLNGLKCQFAVNNVKFIGHSITKAGIGPDSEKVRSMLEYPRPSNTKSLKSFLGMMQFYKRYILHFSKIAAPLNYLLRRDTPWIWDEECENAFQQLRLGLKNAPILSYPSGDPNAKLVLTCDASTKALGFYLSERYPDGTEKLLGAGGRMLRDAEQRYTITEIEALSIVTACKEYRHYLTQPFVIRSDHCSLRYLSTFANSNNARLYRYSLWLSGFQYTVEHIKGTSNGIADGLSRREYEATSPDFSNDDLLDEDVQLCSLTEPRITNETTFNSQNDARAADHRIQSRGH